jgi:hypothetical protein
LVTNVRAQNECNVIIVVIVFCIIVLAFDLNKTFVICIHAKNFGLDTQNFDFGFAQERII